MDCPNCQAANSDDRRFCADCGSPLPAVCGSCGFANQSEARFCGGCGQTLAAAAAPVEAKPAVLKPGGPAAEGERRQVTILFADLAGFTALSSGLDAEDLHDLMSRFFAAVDAVVEDYGGTVDKHIGDAVMALFGAPVAHGDDPLRALRAAMDIHRAVAQLGEETGRPLAVHIGVASGEVLAGGLGGENRSDYTVLGDSVNLASRLDELAEAGETLLSDAVYRAVDGRADCDSLGERSFKGLPDPVRVWRLQAVRDEAPALHRGPFIGRRVEVAQVAGILDVCRDSGRGQAVLLRGEAGMGKTRLVEEFAALAEARGFARHKGLILDFGVGRGQDAVRSLVRSLLEVGGAGDKAALTAAAARAEAEGLLGADQRAFLNDLLDLPQPEPLRATYDAMDNTARNRGKEAAVVTIVQAVSARQPLFLAVEDLHWADSVTLGHLAALATSVRDCPAVLALTSRPEEDPLEGAWRERFRPASLVTIELASLRREEAEGLARTLIDGRAALVRDCIERAGGNPLFLEQLLRNAVEAGAGELPATIQSLVHSRMDRLPGPDKAALQAASVIGQRFSLAIVRHLIDDEDYRPDGLFSHHLVRPEGDGLLFAHALIQESVYASLLKARRRALHLNAAGWFAERDAALHAEHLDRADDPAAPDAYLEAARQTARELHFERASALAARGLEIADEPVQRYSLACLRGELLHDLGDLAGSIEAYRVALDLADGPAQRCAARLGIAAGLRILDRRDEAFALLDEAEREAVESDLAEALARIRHLRGNLFFPLGDFAACRAQHELALAAAREAGSVELEARALGGLADAAYAQGRVLTANRYFSQCVELARRHGFRRIEVANLSMVGFSRLFRGETREAYEDGLATVEAASAAGDLRAELVGRVLLYMALYEMAALADAMKELTRASEIADRLGAGRFLAQNLTYEAKILRREGRKDEARRTVERAVALSLESGAPFNAPRAHSELAFHLDDPRERHACLDKGEAILRDGAVAHNHIIFYPEAMEIALADEDWPAVERYAQALQDFTRSEPLPRCDFYIARARALVRHRRGERGPEIRAEFERLCAQARESDFLIALPDLEAALADA